jgi:carboxyl-terminal processing protease
MTPAFACNMRPISVLLALVLVLGLAPAWAEQAVSGPEQRQTVRIPVKPIVPLKQPRTLIGTSRTRLPNGQFIKQYEWQWTDPRKLSGPPRTKHLGRVMVTRSYQPAENGTLVTQHVLVAPRMRRPPTTDTERAAVALSQVLSAAKEKYVEPVDEAKLLRDAMRGVARGLDRHSHVFNPEEVSGFMEHTEGGFVGVGVVLQQRKEGGPLTIRRTMRQGPAFRAGMRKGDRLLTIGGKPATDVKQASDLLRGAEGTDVKVKVARGNREVDLSIKRGAIDLYPLRTRLTKDGIGYIRFGSFHDGISDKVLGALGKLEKRNKGPLKGLVLDLRNNPGGLMSEAVRLQNEFVAKGTLVSTRGRGGVVLETESADPKLAGHPKVPLAVLINNDSASASELLSGGLRDHGRATLIGEKSWGKGSVQTVRPLIDGSIFKLTQARYHLPGGETPDKVGVAPHIGMDQAKQSYLARHPNPQGKRRIVDYALEQAFDVLRGTPAGR